MLHEENKMMEREGCLRVCDHGNSKLITGTITELMNIDKPHGSGKEVSVPTIFGLQLVCQAGSPRLDRV
jgi:hypothetical protein